MHSMHAGNVSCQSRSLQAIHVLTTVVHCPSRVQFSVYGLYALLQALWSSVVNPAQLHAIDLKTAVKLWPESSF